MYGCISEQKREGFRSEGKTSRTPCSAAQCSGAQTVPFHASKRPCLYHPPRIVPKKRTTLSVYNREPSHQSKALSPQPSHPKTLGSSIQYPQVQATLAQVMAAGLEVTCRALWTTTWSPTGFWACGLGFRVQGSNSTTQNEFYEPSREAEEESGGSANGRVVPPTAKWFYEFCAGHFRPPASAYPLWISPGLCSSHVWGMYFRNKKAKDSVLRGKVTESMLCCSMFRRSNYSFSTSKNPYHALLFSPPPRIIPKKRTTLSVYNREPSHQSKALSPQPSHPETLGS